MNRPHTFVSYKILREILRLPDNIRIIRVDHQNEYGCTIYLSSPSLEGRGKLVAQYEYEHLTNIKFKGFEDV